MPYQHVKAHPDYSDFASGRVFYSLPGHPAFPVRLASEIFQRCLAQRVKIYNTSAPCTLYDPCCGAAYQLSVLAYLHRTHLRAIIGSDIDEKAIALAQQNLGLLTVAGLDKRLAAITTLFALYKKDSHKDALASGQVLKARLSAFAQEPPLITKVFTANATHRNALSGHLTPQSVDIVLTDIPYGQQSHWRDAAAAAGDSAALMLNALREFLSTSSLVAIASDKHHKLVHPGFQRIEQFQIGKRRVTLLAPTYE